VSDPRANPLAGNPLRTRTDLQRAVRDLVEPLLPHQSAGGARVRLGSFAALFPQADAELEGFARPLWGLAPLAAGGGVFAHWDRWRRGLAAGSDPEHPEHWSFYEGTAQTMVEQAAIGLALALVPEQLWEPLSQDAQQRLVEWLSRINRYEPVPNNWQFFRVLVNLGLERVGAPVDEAALVQSLERIDSYYLGEGWYADGRIRNRDHYVGWAFHCYGLIYAWARPDDERSRVFRERARRFARDFEAWFDPTGGVVPFGRSLTYRFAAASFWSALVFADEPALPWGRVKGLLLRHLRWWSERPISDRDGVLSLGWAYTDPWLREAYSSAGSPYWAMKAFLCLAVPETHPFWDAEEEPLPETRAVSVQAPAGMLLSSDATQAVALSGGHDAPVWLDEGAAKYGRFAYSSRFGFSGERLGPTSGGPRDSALTLLVDGEARTRTAVEAHGIEGERLWSRWRPWPDVCVVSVLWGCAPWHLRAHRITTGRSLVAEEGGFALGLDEPGGYREESSPGAAIAHSPFGTSGLRDVTGERAASVRMQPPNSNLMCPYSVVPQLACELEPGVHDLVCAVLASDRSPVDWPELELPADVRELLERHSTAREPEREHEADG
jgi:hypothetical protein